MARHGKPAAGFRPSGAISSTPDGSLPLLPVRDPAAPPSARRSERPRGSRRRRWTPAQLPFRLELPPAGLVLGMDSNGMSATSLLLAPTNSTRVAVVGETHLARLLALRLLSQSCDLTVVTDRPDDWRRLAAGVPQTPFAIVAQVRRWPLEGTPAPWALVIDMPDPPSTGFTRTPWSTVIHVAPSVPQGSGWWQSAHLVLTTRAHAREVAALRPRLDAAIIDRLGDDDVVAVDQAGVTVFQPALSEREFGLLAVLDRP